MNPFGLPPLCKACGYSLDAGEFTHANCNPSNPPPCGKCGAADGDRCVCAPEVPGPEEVWLAFSRNGETWSFHSADPTAFLPSGMGMYVVRYIKAPR